MFSDNFCEGPLLGLTLRPRLRLGEVPPRPYLLLAIAALTEKACSLSIAPGVRCSGRLGLWCSLEFCTKVEWCEGVAYEWGWLDRGASAAGSELRRALEAGWKC